jgi:integral membrane protein (TIGR01906 family)
MRVLKIILYSILICCIPLLVISSNLRLASTQLFIYKYGVDTYPISEVTGISKSDLLKIHQNLIDYYNSRTDTPQIKVLRNGNVGEIFNEKELVHLRDVKGLFQLDHNVQIFSLIILAICIALLLIFEGKWRTVIKGILWGSGLTLGLVIFLALWSIVGFEQLFILFHQLSFTNDFWVLDPGKDVLIMLFPGGFFFDIVLFGFGVIVLQLLILIGISWGLLKTVKS